VARVTVVQNPWNDAFKSLGHALYLRGIEEEKKKIADQANNAFLGFMQNSGNYTPSFSTTTIDGQPIFQTDFSKSPVPNQFGQGGGLIGSIGNEFKLNPSAYQVPTSTPSATTTGFDIKNTSGQPAPASTTPMFQTTNKDWATIQREYRQNAYKQLGDMSKSMDPKAFQQVLPSLRQQIMEQEQQLRADFDKRKRDTALTAFDAEPDVRKKIVIGLKNNIIGKDGAMMLVQPGTETKIINTGGANVVVGYNRFTGRYVDLKDGSEIPADKLQEMLTPTLTPGQVQAGELAAARGAASAGGMSTGDQRRVSALNGIINQHETWITRRKDLTGQVPDESQSPYFKAAQQARAERDRMMFGEAGIQQPQDLPKVNYTGDKRIDGMIDNMRGKGATEQMINDMVWEEQNKVQAPEVTMPIVTGNEYLGLGMWE
jgi:hypothetical protein